MKCPKCKKKCKVYPAVTSYPPKPITYTCSTKTHNFYQIGELKFSLFVNFPLVTAKIYNENNKYYVSVYLQNSTTKYEIAPVKRTQCYWYLEDWINRYLKMASFI